MQRNISKGANQKSRWKQAGKPRIWLVERVPWWNLELLSSLNWKLLYQTDSRPTLSWKETIFGVLRGELQAQTLGRHATPRNETRFLPLKADANRFCLLMHAQSSILYVSPHSCGQLCAIVSVMLRYSALFKMVFSKVYMILFRRRLMLV